MDALDIMANLQQITPYFQAIFNADEHRVAGYEILGRFQTEDGVISLGPFFSDESIPEEFRIEADHIVLQRALEKIVGQEGDFFIFFNQDPNLLMLDRGESLLEMLFAFRDRGLALDRFVIEVTEHNYRGDLDQLNHLLTYFKTYGIKIAVDNIGKESSNLDRIGILSPDILKIDLQALRSTNITQSYHDVLYSISLLARKIGAALLYEDIEAFFQLQYAWRNGGRYYQGFYLHEPSNDFIPFDHLKERLKKEFHQFITHEKRKLQVIYDLSEKFYQKVHALYSKYKKKGDANRLIEFLAQELSNESFRIYICDEDGFQLSANIFKTENGWELKPEYYMKNWSWRPYFLENIMRMRYIQKGFLSDLYSDIETGETIRTFSYPMDDGKYLFIDLSYEFLYENDGL
jgi:EAL domain-containing protein (putative c-di-GMP-specific phosphodiesterase class I)